MIDDRCMLKWSQFQENALRTFNEQRTEDFYIDVTLVADDNSMMKAHKLILSASSDYFSNLFRTLLDINLPSKNILKDGPEYHDLLPKDSENNCTGNTEIDDEIELNFQEISDTDEIPNLEEEHVSNNPSSKENKIKSETDIAGYHQTDFSMGEQMEKDSDEGHYNRYFQNQNLIVHVNGGKTLPYKEFEKCLWQLYKKNKYGFFECNKCSKSTKLSYMKEHVEKHLLGLSFECNICGKIMKYSHQNRKNRDHKMYCQTKMTPIILPDLKEEDELLKKFPISKDPKKFQTESYDEFSTLNENDPLMNDDLNEDFQEKKIKIESNSASPNKQKQNSKDKGAAKQNLSYYVGNETFSHDEFEKYSARLYRTKELGVSECNACGKRATIKAHMKEHVEIHLKDFFVVCTLCGRKMPNSKHNRKSLHKTTCIF